MMGEQIPMIIHFFWFGGNDKSDEMKKCIGSWKIHSPFYRIIEWNEENFDVNSCAYSKEAYENKKYAFVSDYARLKVLYEYGGFYFDTDVLLLKPLDDLLKESMFMGFESESIVSPGLIIGAQRANALIGELLHIYQSLQFVYKGHLNETTIGEYTTALLLKKGLKLNGRYQKLDKVTIFPQEMFCPYNCHTGLLHITPNTYSIHRYEASWKENSKPWINSKAARLKLLLKLRLLSVIGEKTFFKLKYLFR